MKKILAVLIWITGSTVFAQLAPDVYLVELTDKNNSPYSIDKPREFLSQRAINRRLRLQLPVTVQDLPVNPYYLDEIRSIAPVKTVSKWFNSVSVITNDPETVDLIMSLPYVRSVKGASGGKPKNKPLEPGRKFEKSSAAFGSLPDTSFFNYGQGSRQIGMLMGHVLHNQGYQGQGMVIAVLDGGFSKADINPVFDSLWANNQILGNWDFVANAPLTFDKHPHGAQVLSIMAANVPGKMVGTAPKASYFLLRTEDGNIEYPLEEEFWISGAEYADSAGADLINSSLSYTEYDDPFSNHTYEDMDGNSTRVSMAADIAASKGILVVTSAGNKGDLDWKYIGAPADADSVLAVGAVDADGNYASFSSIGPTYDGRISPGLVAQGKDTYYAATNGDIYIGSGTSFSAPIICGLTACLWQSVPSASNMDLIKLILETGSLAENPDNLLGYGLPDFSKAYFNLQGIDTDDFSDESFLRIFPNPFYNSFTIDYISTTAAGPFTLEIWDASGKHILTESYGPGYGSYRRLEIAGLDNVSPGIYIVRIISPESIIQSRILKHRSRQ